MVDLCIVPGSLSLADIRSVLQQPVRLSLAETVGADVGRAAGVVAEKIDNEDVVYGINTGFGSLANARINLSDLTQLQRNIVLSHATGTGDLLPDNIVRLILVLKINSLARGFSGVRPQLLDALITMLNAEIYPCIPERGSVGASGDLVPLAHMSVPLLGEGQVRHQGQMLDAKEGLAIAGLKPLDLAPKEGLALLNGMQVSTAIGLDALFMAENLFATAMAAGSLSIDAACASDTPFDARIHQVRGHPCQILCASMYRALLQGSEIRESHRNCERVQDPYSLRCQPQVMGACLGQIHMVRRTLEIEANAVSDNPLVFPEQKEILSGGNFHGEIIAMAADNLALAIAEIGALSERRIALLIDEAHSRLPAFLVDKSGLNSGFMLAHVTAAASASDNKALAHPHCVDSLPTSANQEDHVSMATNAARRLRAMNENVATIVAIELLSACQGLEFRKPKRTSKILLSVVEAVREKVKAYDEDRYFAPDIERIKQEVVSFRYSAIIEPMLTELTHSNAM